MGDANEYSSCLMLLINDDHILIYLHQVQIVLPIAELNKVPNQDPALEGMLNFHKEHIPVYHLSELINAPKPNYDLNTPILICSLANGLIGLLVSEVLEVVSLCKNTIQNPALDNSYPYVLGIGEAKNNSAWLLDLEKLFTFHHRQFEHGHEQSY